MKTPPTLEEIEKGHWVACYFPRRGWRRDISSGVLPGY
jgi:hypothetical protein